MHPKAREEELITEELTDETLVYDRKRNQVHCLNRTAALIWRHCDGQTSVAEMVTLLRKQDLPAEEEVVWLALDRLEKAHLLQERVPRPPSEDQISRRQVMRKLGMAGGLSLLLPVVTSIVAPTPASAASGGVGITPLGCFFTIPPCPGTACTTGGKCKAFGPLACSCQ